MERYQHDLLAAPGTALGGAGGLWPGGAGGLWRDEAEGLRVEGDGVVLSSLRRRDGWLELRLVREHPSGGTATVTGPFSRARAADLLGRPGRELAVDGGALRLPLGPWEIATVQLA